MKPIESLDIVEAAELVKSGGVILYPTDTIWGIGCDANNSKAVERVFEIKKRVYSKSLIVLVESEERILQYVDVNSDYLKNLLASFQRPTTIIYPNARGLSPHVISGDGSVAIRRVHHPFCEQLIALIDAPMVSTSANYSGEISPQSYSEINEMIKEEVDGIVSENYDVSVAAPSTIIRLISDNRYEIIRP